MAHSHIWGDIGNLLLPLKHHAVYAQAIDWAIFWRFSNADREMVRRDTFPFSQLPESTGSPGISSVSNTSVRGALRAAASFSVFGRDYRYPLFYGHIQKEGVTAGERLVIASTLIAIDYVNCATYKPDNH